MGREKTAVNQKKINTTVAQGEPGGGDHPAEKTNSGHHHPTKAKRTVDHGKSENGKRWERGLTQPRNQSKKQKRRESPGKMTEASNKK